jgi:hypothetical protein
MLDAKQQVLFQKLRKGADSSLSLGQLFKVLAVLGGWKVEERVLLVPFQDEKASKEGRSTCHMIIEDDEAGARTVYGQLEAASVRGLPGNPGSGTAYVMGLEAFRSWPNPYDKGRTTYGAKYKLWIGAPGYRVTSPDGDVFDVRPHQYDLAPNSRGDRSLPVVDLARAKKSLRTYDVLPWLKTKTGYLAQINQALGTEEHVPAAQRTRENTGTCGCCFRNIKLVPVPRREGHVIMALHGYNRPGWGHIVGRCPGGNHAPYELSADATKLALGGTRSMQTGIEQYLRTLASPELEQFAIPRFGGKSQIVKRGDPNWDHLYSSHVESIQHDRDKAKFEGDVYEWLVKDWKVRSLPKEGDKEIFYFETAAKAVAAKARH